MKSTLFISSILIGLTSYSQYQTGNYSTTFQDAERGNRSIQTEIYYPSTVGGTNATVAPGQFPVIVFGHGFVMAWTAYQNLWEEFVPRGYIMVFPRTEGNLLSTDHQEFGWDLEYLVTQIQVEGLNATSPINGAVAENTALMGHSMGGGAAFLAADSLCTNGNTNLKTLIGLAPAESSTNGVSSINSALSVTVPSILLSGIQDGVTPPVDHHIPMYDNLASDCKTFISVTGGAHCYFANSNLSCDFGEGTSSSGISISRTEQHEVTFDFVNLWLDFTLKSQCDNFDVFQDSLANSNRITYNQDCNYQSLAVSSSITNATCNGFNGSSSLSISGGTPSYTEDWGRANPNSLPAGDFTVMVTDAQGCSESTTITITEPDQLLNSVTITEPTCYNGIDGSALLTISGGSPGYSEDWGTENPLALSAGIHSVTVTDQQGCTLTTSVTLTEPSQISISGSTIDVSCYGENNGSAILSVSGVAPIYTENWGTEDPNNLSEGTYTVLVTDALGCSETTSITISEPDILSISLSSTDEVLGSDGTITVIGNGGSPVYTYSINGGTYGSNNTFSNLDDGQYTIGIQDANGCTIYETISINTPSTVGTDEEVLGDIKIYPTPMQNQLTISFSTNDISCQDSYITLSNMVGSVIIEQQIDPTDKLQILDVSNLPKGTYILMIGCDNNIRSYKLVK